MPPSTDPSMCSGPEGGSRARLRPSASRPWALHWLYPVYSLSLRWAGIDSAEDLEDARLRAKWKIGHEALESRIGQLKEARYLSGGGSSFPEGPQIARSGHEQHLDGAVAFAASESRLSRLTAFERLDLRQ